MIIATVLSFVMFTIKAGNGTIKKTIHAQMQIPRQS